MVYAPDPMQPHEGTRPSISVFFPCYNDEQTIPGEIGQEREHTTAIDAVRVFKEHQVAAVVAVEDFHGYQR